MKDPLCKRGKARARLIDCQKRCAVNPSALNTIRLQMAQAEYEAVGGRRNER
jgi:hypothetical protein